MKAKKLLLVSLLLFSWNGFAQIWDKIEAKDGFHYITYNLEYINLPVLGTYLFQGKEPIVELSKYGVGFYQLHEQLKRPVNWGIECDERGALLYKKGFDNTKYLLWYQYTTKTAEDTEEDMAWKMVELTIHFNTKKMFIQGERSKEYTE
ncbi:hypothetical protein [Flavobacterium sp. 25HG05S-40]|uniref:hypothetical protein n=1 Tax=Flavobacterium sp. 25HG05S-40 TaxID=3458682 RepID=UPI004044EDFB